MRLLAIDASTKATGIAIFDANQLIEYQCIISDLPNVFDRISEMIKKLEMIYLKFKPDKIVMEDVLPDEVGHNQAVYKALMYLQAGLVLMFNVYHKKVDLIVASHWRKICGFKLGAEIKREDLKQKSKNLVKGVYNIDVNDDISDAICLGLAVLTQGGI